MNLNILGELPFDAWDRPTQENIDAMDEATQSSSIMKAQDDLIKEQNAINAFTSAKAEFQQQKKTLEWISVSGISFSAKEIQREEQMDKMFAAATKVKE